MVPIGAEPLLSPKMGDFKLTPRKGPGEQGRLAAWVTGEQFPQALTAEPSSNQGGISGFFNPRRLLSAKSTARCPTPATLFHRLRLQSD